ncbi:hypothetical protein PUN28_017081 [Cardiocondyla obscurior]|uniref:Uncharacterized protein n=1 Tax=Cardiocondyla obscurior TaxID=286306 RepID=A0AAW2EMW0_9HYME
MEYLSLVIDVYNFVFLFSYFTDKRNKEFFNIYLRYSFISRMSTWSWSMRGPIVTGNYRNIQASPIQCDAIIHRERQALLHFLAFTALTAVSSVSRYAPRCR